MALIPLVIMIGVASTFAPARSPFEAATPARIWLETMERLSIKAVYPLRSDLNVGDVIATLQDGRFGRMSIHLGHVDLRDVMRESDDSMPDAGWFARAGSAEPALSPSTVAFPFIDEVVRDDASVEGELGFLGLGGSRERTRLVSIRVRNSTTYGADEFDALVRLGRFCRTQEQRCAADVLRKLFKARSEVDPAFVASAPIDIHLVTRVFRSREILTIFSELDDVSAELRVTPPEAEGVAPNATARVVRQNNGVVSIDETFDTDMVFGFKSVVIPARVPDLATK